MLCWSNFLYPTCGCADDSVKSSFCDTTLTHTHVFKLLCLWDLSMWICLLHIVAFCGDAIGPQPLIMISAGWPTAEWELSVAGNFRWHGRVNVRDNSLSGAWGYWHHWSRQMLRWAERHSCKWKLKSTQHSAAHNLAHFCLIISSGTGCPCWCDFALDNWHRLNMGQQHDDWVNGCNICLLVRGTCLQIWWCTDHHHLKILFCSYVLEQQYISHYLVNVDQVSNNTGTICNGLINTLMKVDNVTCIIISNTLNSILCQISDH